ncbi:MAG: methylmalonyl-CoA mutase family protein [Oscillospiraceae bacterium]|nr:methylmalonyl-CoA mutase family protein [Oscillospiraceae bacterium]
MKTDSGHTDSCEDFAQSKLRSGYEKWDKTTGEAVKKRPERESTFKTSSQTEVQRLYTPLDVCNSDYMEDLSFPGEYPYTRGVQPTMYRGRLWTMRQYAGFGTAEESNKRYKYLLEQGQTGLSVAFDLPTQIGYDSDHPLSEGEVGRVGVAIDSLKDMETLLEGVPLDKVSVSMTINSTAAVLLAMYAAIAERQGASPNKVTGTIQNDILKEYIARGTYIFPIAQSMRITTDIFRYCSENLPKFNTISISGYHIREAGSTAIQEVAFTFANAVAYIEAAVKAGLGVDEFAPRLSFFFNSHNNIFEEAAKFRAARRLWAKIMKERFGAKDPKSMMLRFHTQTAGSTLTAQQPENNIVRVSFQALAAVLGGTQSLHTNSRDEAFALPTEDAVMVALRTQQIIAYESGVTDTVDPLAGSYYVENLTDTIEQGAEKYLDTIDKMGGAAKAIESGYVQKEIMESAYSYQMSVESGAKTVVGVNKFVVEEQSPGSLLRVDPSVERIQKEKIAAVKSQRDGERVQKALDNLEEAAKGDGALMPFIVSAVNEYATLGEICGVLREVFGEYRQSVFI